jgi:hypothetical protein
MDTRHWDVIQKIRPDVILWDWEIPGYWASAKRAILESTAPYHFWLEDDWRFLQQVPVDEMLNALRADDRLCQVTLSPREHDKEEIVTGDVGWMVATVPHLANGCIMREKVASSDPAAVCTDGKPLTIEVYIAKCLSGYRSGSIGGKGGPHMVHMGALYSSDRSAVEVGIQKEIAGVAEIPLGSGGCDDESLPHSAAVSRESIPGKIRFHAGVILKAMLLFGTAIVRYPRSRRYREFLIRSIQYMRHTHGWR